MFSSLIRFVLNGKQFHSGEFTSVNQRVLGEIRQITASWRHTNEREAATEARHGLLLRHLVMPNDICGTREIMQWVASELGTDTYVNIMPQYHPAVKVSDALYPEINRCLTHKEFRQATQAAREAGLFRLDVRSARQASILND